MGNRITNVPGSSDYFFQGVVAYSNKAKTSLLDIPSDLIEEYGAVSHQVAQAMAEGVRSKSKADLGVGITGIAGPSGGTAEKPVGLVYVALSSDLGSEVSKNLFLGARKAVKFHSPLRPSLCKLPTSLFKPWRNKSTRHVDRTAENAEKKNKNPNPPQGEPGFLFSMSKEAIGIRVVPYISGSW